MSGPGARRASGAERRETSLFYRSAGVGVGVKWGTGAGLDRELGGLNVVARLGGFLVS